MKVVKRDGSPERMILAGMVLSTDVLVQVAKKWTKDGLFKNEWCNLVGGWCVQHLARYNNAPGKDIESWFESWAESRSDKDTILMVSTFLESLSSEYESKKVNEQLVIDRAGDHFLKVAYGRLAETLQGHVDNNDVAKIKATMEKFVVPEMGMEAPIDVLRDKDALRRAFATDGEPLVRMRGALGEFFGDSLERDGFIAILAPEKRGKCAPGSTRVVRADGSVKLLRDIVREKDATPVLAFDEKSQRIVPVAPDGFWDNGDRMCWSVTTRTGRTVSTTDNHKYLTPAGWKELKDIRVGDYIAVPKCMDYFGDFQMKNEEVKFIAYMMAEGGCTTYGTVFTNMDGEINADFQDACRKLGFPFRVDGINTHVHKANSFRRKYPGALWRVTSKRKKIPECMFKLPQGQIALFLRCFFSCDGYNNQDGGIGICLANKPLVKQIAHLLTRFGIVYRVSYKPSKCEGIVFPAWRLEIRSQENVQQFVDEINMMSYKSRTHFPVKKRKSFLDKFPPEIAKRFYDELQAELDAKNVPIVGKSGRIHAGYGIRARLGDRQASSIREAIASGKPVMRQSFSEALDSDAGAKWMFSDVLWDEITEIKKAGVTDTYDISVPDHHNFIGNDCIIHNSFWLQEIGWQAMRQGYKVAVFQCGDLSEEQTMRRFCVRAAGRPFPPGTIYIPISIVRDDDLTKVDGENKTYEGHLTEKEAETALEKVLGKLKTTECRLRLSVHPNSTVTIAQINGILDSWSRENFDPDVVVIDYADILAPLDGKADSRDQINATWKYMRRISQERHCLVLTATQADAASYDTDLIRMKNFSEDKRKYSHVTGTFALNQIDTEKNRGIYRLNWNVLRDRFENRVVYVAGCLAIAAPAIRSTW